MALVCQKVVSQSRNTLQNGALAAKLGVFMLRSRFAAAKHPAKWGFGSEIESFYASQPFRSNKTPCEMGLWLRNWEFLCFAAVSQLQNTLRNGALAAKLRVFMLHSRFAAAK
uniref:Uncharacterized protein n=1 Tax=Vitis vinifera TaxID=29760 RepID=A5BUR5_VITVI|nr:hypothetical protein VITISV_034950 [Vitis vinifera]